MGANDLILQLRSEGFSVSAANSRLRIAPAEKLTDELKQTILQSKNEILSQLQREAKEEARRQKVLDLLASHPETQRAVIADQESDPDHVIITIGIRSVATFELMIDKSRFDPFTLLDLVDKQSMNTH
jgi:hypothetical protein